MVGETIRQLQAYFEKPGLTLICPQAGGTPFQMSVWRELQHIPYGTTISYGEVANRIGRPNASRAVGAANGANPIRSLSRVIV